MKTGTSSSQPGGPDRAGMARLLAELSQPSDQLSSLLARRSRLHPSARRRESPPDAESTRTSLARIEANRKNAKKSTGPKDTSLTRFNAEHKNIHHRDILLRDETKLPITITEDPLSTVVLGSGMTLDNLSILKEVTIK